jgi:hypothetical protein
LKGVYILVSFYEIILNRNNYSRWFYVDPYVNIQRKLYHIFSYSFYRTTLRNFMPALFLLFLFVVFLADLSHVEMLQCRDSA